ESFIEHHLATIKRDFIKDGFHPILQVPEKTLHDILNTVEKILKTKQLEFFLIYVKNARNYANHIFEHIAKSTDDTANSNLREELDTISNKTNELIQRCIDGTITAKWLARRMQNI